MTVDASRRLQAIRSSIDSDGQVKVSELATVFGVSEMTIRRDLDMLADDGLVERVRGGALAIGPQPFAERFGRQGKAKDRIVEKLAGLCDDGGAIGVDASSTLQRLAPRLRDARELTVVTNGWELFNALQGGGGVTPLLTGGQLDRRTGSLVGPLAVRSTRDFSLRRLLVSASGIDPAAGTTEPTLEEAEVKLALAEVATEIVVAVDHTKLGHMGPARCLRLERIDVLVTDLNPTDRALDPYRNRTRVI